MGLLSKTEQKNQVKHLKDSGAFREIGIARYRQQIKNKHFQELESSIRLFSKKQEYSIRTKKPLSPIK